MFIKLRMVASIFVGISKIEYKPDGGPGDNLCFKHYNATEVHKFPAISINENQSLIAINIINNNQ